MYLLLFYSTILIYEHNSRRNLIASFLYFPRQKNKKTTQNLQCMSTETIFKSYEKPFVASDPENLLSAKITALPYVQNSSDCK